MSSSTEPRIAVGYVRRAHGLGGDVVVRPLTDYDRRFDPGGRFFTDEDPVRLLHVVRRDPHPDGYLVGFAEVSDRDGAEALQGVTLSIPRSERRPLDADEYWPDDLEGMVVITPAGEHLGRVTALILGAAQDRLVVTTGDGREVEVPFVAEIVSAVHPSGGHLVVDPPEGLF